MSKAAALSELVSHNDVVDLGAGTVFRVGDGREYLVVDEREREQTLRMVVSDTVWAFSSRFLDRYVPIRTDVIEKIQELGEDGGEALRVLIGVNMDALVRDAVALDGAGHFLATYDDVEHSIGDYYIYRLH